MPSFLAEPRESEAVFPEEDGKERGPSGNHNPPGITPVQSRLGIVPAEEVNGSGSTQSKQRRGRPNDHEPERPAQIPEVNNRGSDEEGEKDPESEVKELFFFALESAQTNEAVTEGKENEADEAGGILGKMNPAEEFVEPTVEGSITPEGEEAFIHSHQVLKEDEAWKDE